MKILIIILISLVLVIPLVLALLPNTKSQIGVTITATNIPLRIYIEDGGIYNQSGNPIERTYLYEGEQIRVDIFVLEPSGIVNLIDVGVAVDDTVESLCSYVPSRTDLPSESIGYSEFNSTIMAWYDCVLTVEPPIAMQGVSKVRIKAEDLSGYTAYSEERIFNFNPPTAPVRRLIREGIGLYENKDDDLLVNRLNNYLFEGERLVADIFVMEPSGISNIKSAYITVNNVKKNGCKYDQSRTDLPTEIAGQYEFDPNLMGWAKCEIKISPQQFMYGDTWINFNILFRDGTILDDQTFWFLNPILAVSISDNLNISADAGSTVYSNTINVGNDADIGGGVMLDMFISGTDFYDTSNSDAKCPTKNKLDLKNFRYYAVNGAYSTSSDPRADLEGYVPISNGIGLLESSEIICQDRGDGIKDCPYGAEEIFSNGNVLSPGNEMSVTFRLNTPYLCNGIFDHGSIYVFAEAI